MSYAIIRNEKYKRDNLKGIYRHNERRNKNYSNKNIDSNKSYLNYSIKAPKYSYEKDFERIQKMYDLKGQIKTVSNIACEYIITSDKDFFESIGEDETKRYFETAYDFVAEYKDLGKKYIMSAKVHMDEETPHMHLVFIPVVHTTDKKGNAIDKIACSEFWKAKDSYRQLQDAFYEYMTAHNFELERGMPSNKKHLSVTELKEITNYNRTKKTLENIKLELPKVPDISEINRLTLKRDEKIQKEIIEPKDKMIEDLHHDNKILLTKLQRQTVLIDRAEKFEKERKKLYNENYQLENKYKELEKSLDFKLENEIYKIDKKYKKVINKLEEENKFLHKVVDKFKVAVTKFISWVCHKFDCPSEENLVRDFEKETGLNFDVEKQVLKEDRNKEHDLEMEL